VATKLFLVGNAGDYTTGNNDAKLNGTTSGWSSVILRTTVGLGSSSSSISTVAGPTSGLEMQNGLPYAFYSPPLAAAVTISGVITWNIWAAESSASANVAINGRLEKVDGASGAITLIATTARTTEVALTTRAVNNFTVTPGAGVACKKGDRLRARIYGDDAGTMATGFTFSVSVSGNVAATDGDTWLQLTETLTFASEPAGSQVFLTDSASPVSTAAVDREAWTTRGAGVQTAVTNTAAGWTVPIQMTDTAGGTVVEWYTRPLTAFTLGNAVRVNGRALESNAAANAALSCEVAIVNNDGSSPVVWAAGTLPTELGTTEAVQSFLIAGTDVAVTAGQRLRIRLSIDDMGQFAMGASQTATLFYAGAAGATGDTFLTFTQALAELIVPPGPHVSPYPQILAH